MFCYRYFHVAFPILLKIYLELIDAEVLNYFQLFYIVSS